MRIFLTGFMGAGKTTVGRELARSTGRVFVDLDERIEELAGESIPEIFRRHGEARFREMEQEALRTLEAPRLVVATGGGTPMAEENRRWMSRHGLVVWLHPDLDTILARIGSSWSADRPLFRSEAQVRELYRERRSTYRLADREIRIADEETPARVAARLRALIAEESCGT